MDRPLLLDLFACAGGAGKGYELAGFHAVAVDIKPQPHNPHEFYVGDALDVLDTLLAGERWQGYQLSDFSAIHASPPCQDYSESRFIVGPKGEYPRLIIPMRDRMKASGLPWILENVRLALIEMENPVMLCGSSLGLRVQRHRLFDSSHVLFGAGPCNHRTGDVCVFGGGADYIGTRAASYVDRHGQVRYRRQNCRIADARAAMGISWMNFHELSEAIPPAYTEWLGRQLMAVIEHSKAA